MSATDVKNHIGELWEIADSEPVIVERNGTPRYLVASFDKYVAVPREEYDRLRGAVATPRLGFAKHILADTDVDALLQIDLSQVLQEHL
jgi:hypothetical protein